MHSAMKIVFCLLRSEIERRDGGAESLRNLLDGIRRFHGVQISVISAFGTYPCHSPYAPYPWRDSKAVPLIAYFYRMVKKVAADHDIVVLVLPNPAFAPLADIIKQRMKKPIIVNYESRWHRLKDYRFVGDNLSWKNVGRLIAFNKLTSSLAKMLCNKYVVSTNFQKEELIEIGYNSSKVIAIPNCTNISKYRFQDQEKNGGEHNPVVMYLGHFNHSKGVDMLVKAMPHVLKSVPNAVMSLVWSGSGNEYQRIRKLIHNHGLTNHTELTTGIVDISAYLSRADVFVLPYRSLSRTRIIPSLVLEAFSVGVPLVVCDCDPIRDIVEDHKTGIVAPVNDPSRIGYGIIEFLENQGLSEEIVRSQREVVQQRFSHMVVAKEYYQMCVELLNG
jgi:glycosyltransferase involved in cell wall biosynthesis